MVADMLSNKKLNPIVTELIFRGRKLNISLIFITQSLFAVPNNIRLNSTRCFAMKINKFHIIIYHIMTFKTLWIFINCLLQNHILFWLLILLLHQQVWDVPERSRSNLHCERHLRYFLGTSQKRWLFCNVFKTSQIHLIKDVFCVTSLRRLENISKKMLFPWRLWDVSKTSFNII